MTAFKVEMTPGVTNVWLDGLKIDNVHSLEISAEADNVLSVTIGFHPTTHAISRALNEPATEKPTGIWIEWAGGAPPALASTKVDVKFRCGATSYGSTADVWMWNHGGRVNPDYEIVAYRFA